MHAASNSMWLAPNKQQQIGHHGMMSFQPHKANCSCAKRWAEPSRSISVTR